jgi:hypothetical protein
MEVWKYQFLYNPVYQSYCRLLGITDKGISKSEDIPFLPILMFREHQIKTGYWKEQAVFKSSGTTGSIQSRHLIRDLNLYHRVAKRCFSAGFGDPITYAWIGLLPSYLERPDSSLVDMVQFFIQSGHQEESRFFSKVDEAIFNALESLRIRNQPTILIGVSFALLDLFEQFQVPIWDGLTVIETGGMKGRGNEITREELYTRMRRHHPDLTISSEYGMTELLSQAYKQNDHFTAGPSMQIRIRDISDPLQIIDHGQRGVINIIDLANIDTCSFIATDDIGISYPDGSFDVLGRMDNSDLRGCNLMYV